MKIEELGELKLIEHLTAGLKKDYDSTVCLGVGDDAAAIRMGDGRYLLVTVDMLVEGRHFLFDKISPEQLGHKSLAASLSDIAAMGGMPRHAVVSVGWPPYADLKYTEKVYAGMKELAREFGVNIIGGDTVKAPQMLVDVTVLGEMEEEPVARGGARPGDLIAITGRVGASAAGLELLTAPEIPSPADLEPDISRELVQAHLQPSPRVREAVSLTKAAIPTSMIDISDGVGSEIKHICSSSEVGAMLYAGQLPVNEATREAARVLQKNVLDWALAGGEDYELIFTFPENKLDDARRTLTNSGSEMQVVGKILPADSGMQIEVKGEIFALHTQGYDHFQ